MQLIFIARAKLDQQPSISHDLDQFIMIKQQNSGLFTNLETEYMTNIIITMVAKLYFFKFHTDLPLHNEW